MNKVKQFRMITVNEYASYTPAERARFVKDMPEGKTIFNDFELGGYTLKTDDESFVLAYTDNDMKEWRILSNVGYGYSEHIPYSEGDTIQYLNLIDNEQDQKIIVRDEQRNILASKDEDGCTVHGKTVDVTVFDEYMEYRLMHPEQRLKQLGYSIKADAGDIVSFMSPSHNGRIKFIKKKGIIKINWDPIDDEVYERQQILDIQSAVKSVAHTIDWETSECTRKFLDVKVVQSNQQHCLEKRRRHQTRQEHRQMSNLSKNMLESLINVPKEEVKVVPLGTRLSDLPDVDIPILDPKKDRPIFEAADIKQMDDATAAALMNSRLDRAIKERKNPFTDGPEGGSDEK